jgi:hypothetical protein
MGSGGLFENKAKDVISFERLSEQEGIAREIMKVLPYKIKQCRGFTHIELIQPLIYGYLQAKYEQLVAFETSIFEDKKLVEDIRGNMLEVIMIQGNLKDSAKNPDQLIDCRLPQFELTKRKCLEEIQKTVSNPASGVPIEQLIAIKSFLALAQSPGQSSQKNEGYQDLYQEIKSLCASFPSGCDW